MQEAGCRCSCIDSWERRRGHIRGGRASPWTQRPGSIRASALDTLAPPRTRMDAALRCTKPQDTSQLCPRATSRRSERPPLFKPAVYQFGARGFLPNLWRGACASKYAHGLTNRLPLPDKKKSVSPRHTSYIRRVVYARPRYGHSSQTKTYTAVVCIQTYLCSSPLFSRRKTDNIPYIYPYILVFD